MAVYYSRYIKDYVVIVEHLTLALKGKNKRKKLSWSDEMGKAFETVKAVKKETHRRTHFVRAQLF